MITNVSKVSRIFEKLSFQIVPLTSNSRRIFINDIVIPVTKDMKLEIPYNLKSHNFTDVLTEECDQKTKIHIEIKSDLISFKTMIENNVQTDFYKFGFKIQEEGIKLNAHYLGSCYHIT